VSLTFAGTLERAVVVAAADRVAGLVDRPQVADAWARESSCAGMSVGGLTWHLIGQPATVVRLLPADPAPSSGAEPAGTEPIGLLEHYRRAAWVHEDLDGATNRSIRAAADEGAAAGPAAALSRLAAARSQLAAVLADAPATTFLPWQGWSLATDDFLVTRVMEMVVHADDLAASVGLPTPDFGLDVLDPVLRLLAALAVQRHGQDALVRTLARPQRAPGAVSAF
jgi:hypothetical protein